MIYLSFQKITCSTTNNNKNRASRGECKKKKIKIQEKGH
jgi:hypothetical protein